MARRPLTTPPGTKPALTATDPRKVRRGERLFKLVAAAASSTIVVAILLIAIFLLVQAVPSLRANQANFFTSAVFDTVDANHLAFGVRDSSMVTVLSSMCALVLAVPIVIGIASYAGMDIGRDNGLIVDRDYEDKAPYAFPGTVKEVVFDPKPVHQEAEKALHEHASVQVVGQGAAG